MFPHNNEGRDQLLKDYDLAQMQEMADLGGSSGVSSQHIYYGDTIAFFYQYEGEILDLITERWGTDELVAIFKRSEACYDMYRNECTWLFIQEVAQDVVQDNEEAELAQDEMIANYMTQEISNNGYTLDELSQAGYNHPGSMTEARYAQV